MQSLVIGLHDGEMVLAGKDPGEHLRKCYDAADNQQRRRRAVHLFDSFGQGREGGEEDCRSGRVPWAIAAAGLCGLGDQPLGDPGRRWCGPRKRLSRKRSSRASASAARRNQRTDSAWIPRAPLEYCSASPNSRGAGVAG
jgi:hypothetical protein